jgi:hypothetical protein
MRARKVLGVLAGALLLSAIGHTQELPPAADRKIDFTKDVLPILETRCFKCHQGVNSKSGVRLDHRPEILGETSGLVLAAPGKSAESSLVRLVAGLVPDEIMPPKGPRLTAGEIGILRAWIDQGLAWDEARFPSAVKSDHWAFQRVKRPNVPEKSAWARNPVDAFVEAEHRKRGLTPALEASRPLLLRRVSLDLTGLPPAPEEVRAFIEDPSPDAYEKQVDRLLASPHYGERWARHWMDVARYADSEGYESNHPRPTMWRYRDYLVDRFNRDVPFDQFVREQVAGDELEPYADHHLIATGFLSGARLSSNEEDKALQRNDVLVDVVNATASAFLGLTMNCAQCHNHKLEPISQRDYYRLMGFFVKGMPNNVALRDPALWAEFDAKKAPEYDALVQLKDVLYERGRQQFIARAKKKMSPEMVAAWDLPDERRTPEQRELYRQADLAFQATPGGYEATIPEEDKKLYVETKKKLELLRKRMIEEPQAWGFYSPATSPHDVRVLPQIGFYPLPYEPDQLGRTSAFLLLRGDVHRRGPALTPAWPEVLGPTPAIGARPRLALVNWLTSRENPLVARVWANRVWHYHFGRGIAATPGDLGTKGAPPTHPELLDWLASELLEHGWSTKRLHRWIVTSATYRQSAKALEKNASIDPENLYLWHWESRRLESEAIRDSALAASGELDRKVGGACVPAGDADKSLRRSLYLTQKRDGFMMFQTMFDGPSATESCAARHVSTIALQPLLLLNNPFMVERARAMAARVADEAGTEPRRQLERTFELALARGPDAAEREAGEAFLGAGGPDRLVRFCQVVLNLNEFLYLE